MTSLPSIYYWQIYCVTESNWISCYLPTAPTQCPNNTAHIVTGSRGGIILLNSPILTVTDGSPTSGYFQTTTVPINIPVPTSVPVLLSPIDTIYPFNCYVWELSISAPSTSVGDMISVQVGPDSLIGYLISNQSTGDTILNVSSAVFEYVVRGTQIGITDGVNKEYPGLVTTVSSGPTGSTGGTIRVSIPLINSYATGSEILFSIFPIQNMYIDSTNRITIYSKGLTYRFIPAGKTIRVLYTDNTMNSQTSTVYLQLQYFYY